MTDSERLRKPIAWAAERPCVQWPAGSGQMARLIRRRDWTATPLGAIEDWPANLRAAVDVMLASARPCCLGWGSRRLLLYNDAFAAALADAHPAALGEPAPSTISDEVPLLDAEGRPAGFLSFGRTESCETGAHFYFRNTREGFCTAELIYDADGTPRDLRFLSVNPAFAMQSGLTDVVGRTAREVVPGIEQSWFDTYARVIETGEPARFEAGAIHSPRWFMVRAFRIGDPSLARVAVLFTDILPRRRAEAAQRESERRLQALVDGIPQLVWRACEGGAWTWCSRQWTDYTGQTLAEARGFGWLEALHPDDREPALRFWRQAGEDGQLEMEGRLRRASDGTYHWFQTRATPDRDAAGNIVEWLGTSTDIDDLRTLQQRQQSLLAELQHRVRNVLTVVRSILNRTAEESQDLSDMLDHFRGRLDALARMQAGLTQTAAGTVDLENMIRDELLSVGAGVGGRVTLTGPDVDLPARTAEPIGLALHELTTNALKFGALKVRGGTLDIRWALNMDDRGATVLDLTWSENGVPAIGIPPREGFGRELIEEALPYRLGATTELVFRGGGVRCRMVIPLPVDGVPAGNAA